MNDMGFELRLAEGTFARPAEGGNLMLFEDGRQLGQAELRGAGRYSDALALSAARERLRSGVEGASYGRADRPRQCQNIPDLAPLTRDR